MRVASGTVSENCAACCSASNKTRNVVLLFTAYSVVLTFLAAVFGGVGGSFFVFVLGAVWFLAAGYFLIKRITGFERIVDALRRLRAGDLGFKLTDMPEGVFAEMAEDINSLGDGMAGGAAERSPRGTHEK